jgi:alpha-mannosidase
MEQDELPGTYRGRGGRYVQKWVDVSNEKIGVCVGTDCVSHILNGTDVCPMLIRTAYSCGTPNHWYYNTGRHSFKFSLLPHFGGWDVSGAFRIGWQHITPMPVGRMNICAPIAPISGRTVLPQSYSLCRVSPDNVILTAIKKPNDYRDGYIARLVEMGGKGADVSLQFGFKLARAWKTDLMEQDTEELTTGDNGLRFHISPHEIYTMRILPEK